MVDWPETLSFVLGGVTFYEIKFFRDGRINFLTRNHCPRAEHISPTWSAGHLEKRATTATQRLNFAYQDNTALVH